MLGMSTLDASADDVNKLIPGVDARFEFRIEPCILVSRILILLPAHLLQMNHLSSYREVSAFNTMQYTIIYSIQISFQLTV